MNRRSVLASFAALAGLAAAYPLLALTAPEPTPSEPQELMPSEEVIHAFIRSQQGRIRLAESLTVVLNQRLDKRRSGLGFTQAVAGMTSKHMLSMTHRADVNCHDYFLRRVPVVKESVDNAMTALMDRETTLRTYAKVWGDTIIPLPVTVRSVDHPKLRMFGFHIDQSYAVIDKQFGHTYTDVPEVVA
jgi:hypothetical protein